MQKLKAKYKRGDYFMSMTQGNIIVITRSQKVPQNFKYVYRYWFKNSVNEYAGRSSFIHEQDIDKYWIKLGKGAKILHGK